MRTHTLARICAATLTVGLLAGVCILLWWRSPAAPAAVGTDRVDGGHHPAAQGAIEHAGDGGLNADRTPMADSELPSLEVATGEEFVVFAVAADTGELLAGAELAVDAKLASVDANVLVTDGEGKATVRLQSTDAQRLILTARHGDRYGELWPRPSGSPDATERTVFLHPDTDVVVQVADAGGHPVEGEPVVLNVRSWPAGAPELHGVSILTGCTDARGSVTFEHAQASFRRDTPEGELGCDVMAALPGLGVTSGRQRARFGTLRFELTRPATSRVAVVVDGWQTAVDGLLCRIVAAGHVGPSPAGSEVLVQSGSADFDRLLPGNSYRLELLQRDRRLTGRTIVAPPAGVSMDVVLGLDGWRAVTARMFDRDGGAVVQAQLQLIVEQDGQSHRYACATDDAGRVAAWVESARTRGARYRWQVVAGWPDPRAGMRSPERAFDHALAEREPFAHAVLSHEGMELVAQGRVVDDRGRPERVVMMLAQPLAGNTGELDVCFVPSDTDVPGAFLVLGEVVDAQFGIRAAGNGWFVDATCTKGDQDCRIVHARDGTVVAFVEGAAAASLQLRLRRRDQSDVGANTQATPSPGLGLPPSTGAAAAREPTLVRSGRDGCRFEWRWLAAGTYDLEVRSAGHSRACLEVSGIVVGPGLCEDERLRQLSVASMARAVRVRLRAPSGRSQVPRLKGEVLIRRSEAEGPCEVVPVVSRHGELSFFTARDDLDVRVCLEGHVPFDLPTGSIDLVVDLVPRPRVQVSLLAVDSDDGGRTRRFRVRATRVRPKGRWAVGPDMDADGRRRWYEVDVGRTLEMPVPSFGTYELEVEELVGATGEAVPVDTFEPQQLQVGAGQDVQVIVHGR